MKLNGQPERWIVAARLSRVAKQHRDRDDVINGIATQDERAAEWARAEGHVIVHCTKDPNVSGSVPPWERPELGPWLTEPDKIIQYDGIVAYAVDRLSREYYDLTWLRKWAEANHKKLYVIKDRLRWPDDRDGMLWGIFGERAHQEKEDIRERVMRQNDALRAAGKLVGRPPFGYAVEGQKYDRKLVPTAVGREYVPTIFQKMIDGCSQDQIAQWLRDERVEPVSGVWWTRTIGTIIRNPVYMGRRCARAFIPPDEVEERDGKAIRYRYGKNWVSYPRWVYGPTIHRCEPLVDAGTWQRANEALSNVRPKRGRVNVEARAMLSGALYCADCGDSPMYRHNSPSPRKGRDRIPMFYYRCRGRGAQHASCGLMIPLGLVDAAVDGIIRADFDTPVMVKQIIPGNEPEIAARLAEIDFELQQLGSRGLTWAEEDAARAELRAERVRVAATEIIPDDVRPMPTGETYRQVWDRTPANERGPWLARNGFKVYASKAEVTVAQGETSSTASL
jgi:DNA invertase Pin-like site-specific DNA recombinase